MFPERAPPDLLEDEMELKAREEALAVHRACSDKLLKEKKLYSRGTWNVKTVTVCISL